MLRHAPASNAHDMVPRVGRTTPYQQAPSTTMNGEPPPATLAAQIADRLASSRHDQDWESFQTLLREILETGDGAWQADGDSGTDATVNSRLVWVIVQAGLGTSFNGLSAKGQQDRSRDIVRSIQAIDRLVVRSPEVLYQP